MPSQNVNLSEQHCRFIKQSVSGGGFRTASEVVRAGLRLLEHQQQANKMKLQTLRKLTQQAFSEIDDGKFETVSETQLDAFVERISRPKQTRKPK